MKLSIIIPLFNEEKTIEEVLKRVVQTETPGFEKEIIVVDDKSTDSSKSKVSQFKAQNLKIIEHKKNQGKGRAIQTGLKEARGDLILIQDADLEYDPNDYKKLLKAYSQKRMVIYGSRKISPQKKGYFHYYLASKLLNFLVNLFFGSKLTDVYTCYKLIPLYLIKDIPLKSRGFEIEVEITVKLLKMGIAISEVPIQYQPRTFKEGKKIRFKDGLIGLWTILRNKVQ